MDPIVFTCACCGKEITGLPDLAFDAPVHYHDLPAAERRQRARLGSDFCVIDGKDRFIRGVCPVPIRDTDTHFAWGVWVSLSEANFARYHASFDDGDQSRLGAMFGWLCNRLPVYPETLHLQTTVVPRDGGERPLVWINEAHHEHPLTIDQREGMTTERLGEIYASQICQGRDSPANRR
jgi:hypothetical protein